MDTKGQSLSAVLADLAQRTNAEILLASPSVTGRPAPVLRGRFTVEEALVRLLADSDLTFRRTPDGTYVIYAAQQAPAEDQPVALPELLVVSKRTQNSDIRRTQNDIQPYRVWDARDLEQSHASSVEDFLRTRVTENAQRASVAQDVDGQLGSSRSSVDLRGLGDEQTLVLIDGRRLPSLPTGAFSGSVAMRQPDLNGVPLSAIDRIEVLNSTAGGIYGPGATGGVVNVVLKRDYRGADLGVTYGQSSRGDAAMKRIDGRIGFTPDEGRTDVMLSFSHATGPSLNMGARDYLMAAHTRFNNADPSGFLSTLTFSSSLNILSMSGSNLIFDAAHGGKNLGSTVTYAPVNYLTSSDGGAVLLGNAGKVDTTLSPDATGARRSLLTRPTVTSFVGSLRHHFGPGVEAYIDVLALRNDGRAIIPLTAQEIYLPQGAAGNPFAQPVAVSFPLSGFDAVLRNRTQTARATLGLIADLPFDWKANADYSLGRSKTDLDAEGSTLSDDFYYGLLLGRTDIPNVLGGQQAFLAGVEAYRIPARFFVKQENHFGDLSLRLAGPLMMLPGGPLTLSLLAEDRREHVPASTYSMLVTAAPDLSVTPLSEILLRTRSYYAELRAPLTDIHLGPQGLKGLELQLAVRRDRNRQTLPSNLLANELLNTSTETAQETTDLYTAGLKVFPVKGVMLRASIATGALPPRVSDIAGTDVAYTSDFNLLINTAGSGLNARYQYYSPYSAPADPMRGGARLGSEKPFDLLTGGSTHLDAEHARSLSAGVVLTPPSIERLRVSLDVTRIEKRREIVGYHSGDAAYFLNNEASFPDRVTRAALTDADRAKGYTGGVVTVIDTTSFNLGKTSVDAVDAQLDYLIPTVRRGDIRFHASGTWQPRLRSKTDPDRASTDAAGYSFGPVEWRGQGGLDWSRGPLALGINAVYYGRYQVAFDSSAPSSGALLAKQQGSSHIPSQIYFDVFAARQISFGPACGTPRAFDIRFGVQNLFDQRPPIVVESAVGYSTYGDPRRRRYELSLISNF